MPRVPLFTACTLTLASAAAALGQVDLLPDITVRQSDLFDHQIVNQGGRRLLRLSNGTPNIGAGKLYLYGVLPANPDGTQDVNQRIFRSDGSTYDRFAGRFIYHPGHSHIHFENWAQYRLREILPGDLVGPVIAEGAKTSFCILDLQVHDSSLPGFNPGGEFRSCASTVQGLSVGWLDIYSKGLDGQYIDISFVEPGQYWLESEVDPLGQVLEATRANNTQRIKVTITGVSGPIAPDLYEPNDRIDQVSIRPVGTAASPNLGPVGPATTIPDLSIHAQGNADYFRFYNPGTGGPLDIIRLDYDPLLGDLGMELVTDTGQFLMRSEQPGRTESMTLFGRPRGWYYVRIYGSGTSTSPAYRVTIDPGQSASPPAIAVTSPPAGDIQLIHGADTYRVEWTASDADADPTWVTVFLNTQPVLDGNQVEIPTSLHTPGDTGFHIINSAYVEPGTYWVYAEITDGDTKTGAWSPGTVTFIEGCAPDLNRDGLLDFTDYLVFLTAYDELSPLADFNADGFIDFMDYLVYIDLYATGC